NRVNSATYPVATFDNNNLATAQCIGLDTSTVTNKDPYNPTCWGNGFSPSATGIQHSFGLMYYLASKNIPIAVALRTNKEALGDYDFYVTSSDGSTNPVYALGYKGLYGSVGACQIGSGTACYGMSELGGTSTSMGGASAYYRGAPFIIDAAYAQ